MSDTKWLNASGGAWEQAGNWATGAAPGASSLADLDDIASGQAYTVTDASAMSISGLDILSPTTLLLAASGQSITIAQNLSNGGVLGVDTTGNGGTALQAGGMMSNQGQLTIGHTGMTQATILSANYVWQSGTVTVTGGAESTFAVSGLYQQVAGVTDDNGLINAAQMDIVAGVLQGGGAVWGAVTNDGGVISPTTTLSIDGSYNQTEHGTLAIDLGASGASTSLAVSGTTSLAGALAIDASAGTSFTLGESFTIMTYDLDSFSGTFSALDYNGAVGTNGSVAIGNGLYLTAKYDNQVGNLYGAVTLVVTSAPELPPSLTMPAHLALVENTPNAVNGLSVAAPAGETVTATLGVASGSLTIAPTTGVTVNGNGGKNLTLTGTTANIDAALATLTAQETNTSSDKLTMAVTAADGQTANSSVAISVSPGAPIVLGSGASTISLGISEDAWQGDAQFIVTVNGQQIGGVQTAIASHSAGASQTFQVEGNFASGRLTVGVTFLNDAWGGNAQMDRNLYIDGMSLNGVSASVHTELTSSGTYNAAIGAASTTASLGSGPNAMTINLSEDAWQGDATAYIYVDGNQIGAPQSITASHAAGQSEAVTLYGNFAPGQHTISVKFTNDAWGGSSSTDRNLYIDSVSINGQTSAVNAPLYTNGVSTVAVDTATVGANMPQLAMIAPSGSSTIVTGGAPTSIDFSAWTTGNDIVGQFTSSDLVTLNSNAISGWAALQSHLSQSASGAILTLGANHAITFAGVAASSLQASNFLFKS